MAGFRMQVLFLLSVTYAMAQECYDNDMVPLRCGPGRPFCLKANSYDGNVYRACAALDECPQGESCEHILFTYDGTTDFVCCCLGDLCNSALTPSAIITFVAFFFALIVHYYA